MSSLKIPMANPNDVVIHLGKHYRVILGILTYNAR